MFIMAQKRSYSTAKDPRKVHPRLRNNLRKRVYATQSECGVCGNFVDVTLAAGSPMSPELDEIVPVSRGGSPYDIDNLQLTHRVCNRRKGAQMPGDKLAEDLNPTPNSRAW